MVAEVEEEGPFPVGDRECHPVLVDTHDGDIIEDTMVAIMEAIMVEVEGL